MWQKILLNLDLLLRFVFIYSNENINHLQLVGNKAVFYLSFSSLSLDAAKQRYSTSDPKALKILLPSPKSGLRLMIVMER